MQTVPYNVSSEIPVVASADVVVVGGGPGGLGAAVMAARAGASVVLVERYGCLGGMASVGEVQPFMPNHAFGESLDKPVYVEWLQRMHAYLPPDLSEKFDPQGGRGGAGRTISKDLAMLGAEDLCLEAGVQLLYHHWLCDVIKTGQTITHAVFAAKGGYAAVAGKTFIDCSGDADLAAFAGAEFEKGGPTGHCQPMTLCFKLAGIDRSRMPNGSEITRRYDEAKARGEIDCVRENVLYFGCHEEDVIHFNTTRIIHKDGTNAVELSEAEIDGRRQLREYLAFLRKDVPGFENARIHSVAHHIGIRETRRVIGEAFLTIEAFEKRQKFDDAICRCRYPVDIHNPDGKGTDLRHIEKDAYYEIPFGCTVAKGLDNLAVGGRPISVDHALHSSMRVMPPACSVGQGAGIGAAMAAASGSPLREIDGKVVRAKLVEMGANL